MFHIYLKMFIEFYKFNIYSHAFCNKLPRYDIRMMFREGEEDGISPSDNTILLDSEREYIHRISSWIGIEHFDRFTSYPLCHYLFWVVIVFQCFFCEDIEAPSDISIMREFKFLSCLYNKRMSWCCRGIVEIDSFHIALLYRKWDFRNSCNLQG